MFQVDESGTYRVFCTLHGTSMGQGMAGVLIVEASEETAKLAPDQPAVSEKESSMAPGIVLIFAIGVAGALILPASRWTRRREVFSTERSGDKT